MSVMTVERNHLAFLGGDHHESIAGSRGARHRPVDARFPQCAAAVGGERRHAAFWVGCINHVVIQRRPQRDPLFNRAGAAVGRPEFVCPLLGGEILEFRGFLTHHLAAAATGEQQQCAEKCHAAFHKDFSGPRSSSFMLSTGA